MSKPIDWSKPIQTREGKKARYLGELKGDRHAVAIETGDGKEWVAYYEGDARYFPGATVANPHDILNIRQRIKREVWLNVYSSSATAYETKASADSGCGPSRIACIKGTIDCEEGDGL